MSAGTALSAINKITAPQSMTCLVMKSHIVLVVSDPYQTFHQTVLELSLVGHLTYRYIDGTYTDILICIDIILNVSKGG